jgi:hypothetical protein
MTDPVAHIARAAVAHLAAEHGPALLVDVEAALHACGSTQEPEVPDSGWVTVHAPAGRRSDPCLA